MAAPRKKKSAPEESGFTEFINRFKANPLVFGGTFVILVIVVIAFVFIPALPERIGDGRDGDFVFGYYKNKPIAHNYNNYFDRTLREVASYMGFDLQSDYSRNSGAAYQVWYTAYMRTLLRTVILDEMAASGYTVPSKEIDRLVAELPDFLEDGRFSIVKYNNYDKNRLLTLWHTTEGNYITGKYMESLIGLHTSSAEKAFMGAMASPERTFDMASFPRSAYPDTEFSAFADENPDIFRITRLSRITLASEKEALQVLEMVQSEKTTFEDAARNHSADTDKDKGGDMGLRMTWELFSDIAEETDRDTVFSLKQGELSPVLKAPNDQWTFFRMEETPYAPDLSQSENLAKVRSYMTRFEGGRIENWLVARVEELLAGAKQQNISLSAHIEALRDRDGDDPLFALSAVAVTGSIGSINLNYGNLGGGQGEWGLRLFPNTLDTTSRPELGSAVSNDNFWRTAFSIPLNEPSAPFTLGTTIVVLTATEEMFQDESSIQNIGDSYAKGWMFNAIDAEFSAAILSSNKLEDRFMDAFFPLIMSPDIGASEE